MKKTLWSGLLMTALAVGCVQPPRAHQSRCPCGHHHDDAKPVDCTPGPAPVMADEVTPANAHAKAQAFSNEMDWYSRQKR